MLVTLVDKIYYGRSNGAKKLADIINQEFVFLRTDCGLRYWATGVSMSVECYAAEAVSAKCCCQELHLAMMQT